MKSDPLCVVAGCARPRPREQFVCRGCVHRLEQALGDVPALWRELTVTMTRQDAVGSDGGRRSADSGLPFKPNASEARWILANTVGSWARLIAEHAGISQLPARPARWLLINVQSIAMHPAADEAYDEITSAVKHAYRAIDRVPDLLLAGACDDQLCRKPLYARPDAMEVACECGVTYSTAERHDAMVAAAGQHLVPATIALSWAHKLLGHVIPRGTWDSWTSRKRIQPHSVDAAGTLLYAFGEVRVLAEQWSDRTESRRAKQPA